jgi:hypothetical protein
MMKVFDILTPFNYSQVHSVVAESMAKAEETFLKTHPFVEIREIRLHSNYVTIQGAPAEDSGSGSHVVQHTQPATEERQQA